MKTAKISPKKTTKVLILDESSWRCGGYPLRGNKEANSRGEGNTLLLNKHRKQMCCLGQFSLQLNPKIKKKDLDGFCSPKELHVPVPHLTTLSNLDDYEDTTLAVQAMRINDDETTRVVTKVKRLTALFAKAGLKIVFNPKKK